LLGNAGESDVLTRLTNKETEVERRHKSCLIRSVAASGEVFKSLLSQLEIEFQVEGSAILNKLTVVERRVFAFRIMLTDYNKESSGQSSCLQITEVQDSIP
jgi:hypothetical protein